MQKATHPRMQGIAMWSGAGFPQGGRGEKCTCGTVAQGVTWLRRMWGRGSWVCREVHVAYASGGHTDSYAWAKSKHACACVCMHVWRAVYMGPGARLWGGCQKKHRFLQGMHMVRGLGEKSAVHADVKGGR